MSVTIKKIEDLIEPLLDRNKQFVNVKISKLTSAGDNYGSLMLAVEIIIKNEKNQQESIYAVAKMFPANQFVQKLFNSVHTFKNEVGYYKTITPCLREFLKRQGMLQTLQSFPDFIGSRLSLDPEIAIDENAILLIKNIKEEGFTTIDRTLGFDLEQSKLILKKMAELHGTCYAFKELQPEIFQKEIGRFFDKFRVFDTEGDDMLDSIINSISEDEFCKQNLSEIRAIMQRNADLLISKNSNDYQGPFSSFVHSDMWINNIMLKIIDNQTIDVKFVDYQIYEWSSLSRDVIFFLFTSVQLPVIQKYCDKLLEYYFDCLVDYLKQLKCPISFTFEQFLSDIKEAIQQSELFHIMLMLRPIYSEEAKEVEKMEKSDFVESTNKVGDNHKKKGYFIIHEFSRRKWIL